MPKFHITAKIPSPPEKLITMATQFKKMPEFFQYLKNIEVLEQKENVVFLFKKNSHILFLINNMAKKNWL